MGDYSDHGWGYRPGFSPYGGAAAAPERRQLEIVIGKEYSANQIYVTPYRPPRPRSPNHYPVYPPPQRAKSGGSSGGGGFGCFGDPEMKRRRRVASYKAYAVEGKLKASIRRGIRWIKGKCSVLVHGW